MVQDVADSEKYKGIRPRPAVTLIFTRTRMNAPLPNFSTNFRCVRDEVSADEWQAR